MAWNYNSINATEIKSNDGFFCKSGKELQKNWGQYNQGKYFKSLDFDIWFAEAVTENLLGYDQNYNYA